MFQSLIHTKSVSKPERVVWSGEWSHIITIRGPVVCCWVVWFAVFALVRRDWQTKANRSQLYTENLQYGVQKTQNNNSSAEIVCDDCGSRGSRWKCIQMHLNGTNVSAQSIRGTVCVNGGKYNFKLKNSSPLFKVKFVELMYKINVTLEVVLLYWISSVFDELYQTRDDIQRNSTHSCVILLNFTLICQSASNTFSRLRPSPISSSYPYLLALGSESQRGGGWTLPL